MSLAIYMVASIAGILLPTVSAGGFYCVTCPSNPLQSPTQCNMSATKKDCTLGDGMRSGCFAATAELNNGTIISLKECYNKKDNEDICGNTTACNRAENMTGVVSPFKRCVAKCCSTDRCNKYLVPDMVPVPSNTQTGPASTSIALTASTSIAVTPATTSKAPESGGINIKTFCFLPVFLLFGIQMAI